jgi:hypothetical protein
MRLRGFAVLALALSAPCLFGAVAVGPVVNKGMIDYQTNQVTLVGSGFEPTNVAPMVVFSRTTLRLVSANNDQIVATLPSNVPAGTFSITVTVTGGASTVFDMTYGAVGPQGPIGPQGAVGRQGEQGVAGPTGPQGPQGTVLSYSASGILPGTLKYEDGVWGRFSAVILKNPGVYILSGEIALTNIDSSYTSYSNCQVVDASGKPQGGTSPWMAMEISPGFTITIPVNGFWVSSEPNTEIWLECSNFSPSEGIQANGGGSFVALQVQ